MGGFVPPAIPADEPARLAALRSFEILDSSPEAEFDAIVQLAAQICKTPIALLSLIDERRQWFKAKVGIDADETPREVSFCGHAILGDALMEVPDTRADPRFAENPYVTAEPQVQFYAGVPLRTATGHVLGTLCVIDHEPRALTDEQKEGLERLADQVVRLFELRRSARLHRDTVVALQALDEDLREGRATEAALAPRGIVLGASLLAALIFAGTLLSTFRVRAALRAAERARLVESSQRAERFLEERGRNYGEILRGAAALFGASEYVSSDEFHAYVASLSLPRNYPGLIGLGYVQKVTNAELPVLIESVRSERAGFAVHPLTADEEHYVVRMIEPIDHNRIALGFDFSSEGARRAAAISAAQAREPTVSDRIHLLQDPTHGPGFVMLVPIEAPMAIAERGGPRVQSWVYAVMRSRDLLVGVDRAAGSDVDVTILDDDQAAPLYGRDPAGDELARARIDLGGRSWQLVVAPGRSFASLMDRGAPWGVLALGTTATLLVAGLVWSLRTSESRSQILAGRMTQALRRSERTLRDVVDGTADFIVAIGDDGRLELTNRALREGLRYTESQALTMTILDVVDPGEREAFAASLTAIREGLGTSARLETRFAAADGSSIDVEGVLSVVREDERTSVRGIFRDVSARKRAEAALVAANAELARLAALDALTGVANRGTFDRRLAEEWARAFRQRTPLSVVMVDVDHFKTFNDRYGHPEGDRCLKKVSGRLRAVARRAGEVAARYGGEEFVLLLPGVGADDALATAEQLRASIEGLRIAHERHPLGIVTASLGVATIDLETMSGEAQLVAAADSALYRAKHQGRNRVEHF